MQEPFSHSHMENVRFGGYPLHMSLKLNIREIRQAKGLTLSDLAEAAGVSVPHMSQVERGIKNVNNHLLVRIAAGLGVSPEDLIAEGGEQDSKALASLISQLDDDDKLRVQHFVDGLLASQQGKGRKE